MSRFTQDASLSCYRLTANDVTRCVCVGAKLLLVILLFLFCFSHLYLGNSSRYRMLVVYLVIRWRIHLPSIVRGARTQTTRAQSNRLVEVCLQLAFLSPL